MTLLVALVDRQQRGDQLARVQLSESGSRKTVVASRRTPPQPGAPLEQLFPGQADLQHRRSRPLHEVLDQVEHPLVGPVDVLPHEHQRPLARETLDRCAHGGEERLARALGRPRSSAGSDSPGALDPEQAPDQPRSSTARRPCPRARIAEELAQPRRQLRPRRRRRVAVDDRALRADHLAERPVRDARAIRQAAPAPDRRRRPVAAAPARTPRAGATCRPPLRRSRSPGAPRVAARRARPGCAAERARRCGRRAARAPGGPPTRRRARAHRRERLPRVDRLGLALELERLERAVVRSLRAWPGRCARRPSPCPAAPPPAAGRRR